MRIYNNSIKPIILKTLKFDDARGFNAIIYEKNIISRLPQDFHIVQINQAFSNNPLTLRGLHYQVEPHAQAKLCYALTGSVFNVALNISTGEIHTAILKNGTTMFIPRGYAHGYLTLEPNTLFQWCVDNDYVANATRVIHYSSLENWPVNNWSKVIISDKDMSAKKWYG